MEVFYSTHNGERNGRNSHFHRNEDNALLKVVSSNAAAIDLGIKTQYKVASTTDTGIESKNIRD